MNLFFSMKAVRLLSAISISIWMAGGCLFTCSGGVMAAEPEPEASSSKVVVASHNCHATRSRAGTSFAPAPRGTIKDCPLAVSAVAATAKNSSHLQDLGRSPVSALSLIPDRAEQSDISAAVAYVPNRGPTHLRCCVFLI